VLVVEDEAEAADLYTKQLRDSYHVMTAYSGEEALEMIDPRVDIVLLDRRMPGLSGDEVLEEIRVREIPCRVIMVTAIDPDVEIIDLPFDEYLTKPVTGEELHETIERMLGRQDHDAKAFWSP
jgi:DNA-binding response OmpR family regulator